MIPAKSDRQVTNTLDGEVHKVELDASAHRFLEAMLTEAYKDRLLACIREYSTNALDSHIMSGQKSPIQVTLPTAFTPFLIIKDQGLGMDKADIERTYRFFGASTKRETNDTNGVLGIGSKAALAYTAQFNVVAIKDGKKITVSVSKDETGSSMTIVDEVPTTEHNGVEIVIPTKRGDEADFRAKAEHLFSFWPKGTVLLDGKEPEHVTGLEVSDKMLLIEGEGYNPESYVVMGNVPYPIPPRYNPVAKKNGGYTKSYLVAFIDMGEITFLTSRESLQETPSTVERLERLKKEFQQNARESAQTKINEATTKAEALLAAMKWTDALQIEGEYIFTFEGKDLPTVLKPIDGEQMVVTPMNGYKLGQKNHQQMVMTSTIHKTVFVYNFKSEFVGRHKRKLRKWVEDQKLEGIQQFVLTDAKIKDVEWVSDSHQVDWETVKKIAIETNSENSSSWSAGEKLKKITGSYECWIDGVYSAEVAAADFDDKKAVYYFGTKEFGEINPRGGRMEELFKELGGTIIRMPANRLAKFQRDFPNAKEVKSALKKVVDKKIKAVTSDDILAWQAHQDQGGAVLESLKPQEIDDPKIKKLLQLKQETTRIQKVQNVLQLARSFGHWFDTEEFNPKRQRVYDVLNSYPLLSAYRYGNATSEVSNHKVLYINAVYNRKKGN